MSEKQVWYQIEISPISKGEWTLFSARDFDTQKTAQEALRRHIKSIRDVDDSDYRIVAKILEEKEVYSTCNYRHASDWKIRLRQILASLGAATEVTPK